VRGIHLSILAVLTINASSWSCDPPARFSVERSRSVNFSIGRERSSPVYFAPPYQAPQRFEVIIYLRDERAYQVPRYGVEERSYYSGPPNGGYMPPAQYQAPSYQTQQYQPPYCPTCPR
jgi:hypothetical protein